jgi:hypothetical protein
MRPFFLAFTAALLIAAGCRAPDEADHPREAGGAERSEDEDEKRPRGTPDYLAPTEILPQPFASSAASGWDSERLWSRHVDWEPAIAADPSAPYIYQLTTRYHVPACNGCGSPAIVFRRSSNGGQTWENDTYPAPASRWQADPQIEVASDGTIYAAYLQGFRPGVVLQKSSDLGVTWTEQEAVQGAEGPRWSDKPWLAISSDGRDVYIAFNSGDSYVASSHDYGRTFDNPVRTNQDERSWFHGRRLQRQLSWRVSHQCSQVNRWRNILEHASPGHFARGFRLQVGGGMLSRVPRPVGCTRRRRGGNHHGCL